MSGPLPPASVSRLPRYLRYVEGVGRAVGVVSSDDIALGVGVSAVQVRKDLSYLGAAGTRGVGYEVRGLTRLLSEALGLGVRLGVAIVGAGNLGSALAKYQGFELAGFRVEGLYDINPALIGESTSGLDIRHLDRFTSDVARGNIHIGIISTPSEAAQFVCTLMVEAGIRSILNFAPAELVVPAGVTVRRVDLATELQILSYHLTRPESDEQKAKDPPVPG